MPETAARSACVSQRLGALFLSHAVP